MYWLRLTTLCWLLQKLYMLTVKYICYCSVAPAYKYSDKALGHFVSGLRTP